MSRFATIEAEQRFNLAQDRKQKGNIKGGKRAKTGVNHNEKTR